MSKVRDILEHAILLALLVCSIGLARLLFLTGNAVRDVGIKAQLTLQSVDQSSTKIAKSIEDLKVMLNATLYQVGDASHEVAETAREQKKYWDQTGEQTVLAMKQLNEVLAQANQTIADADQSQNHISASVISAVDGVNQTLATSQETLSSATQAIQSLNAVVANPAIPNTLQHVDAMSLDVQKAVHDWTKPKSIAKSILGFLLDTASKVAVIFK